MLAMAAVSAMAAELVRVGARAGAAEERARKAEAMIEELQAENARLREAASATRQQESAVVAESQEQCLALLGRVLGTGNRVGVAVLREAIAEVDDAAQGGRVVEALRRLTAGTDGAAAA